MKISINLICKVNINLIISNKYIKVNKKRFKKKEILSFNIKLALIKLKQKFVKIYIFYNFDKESHIRIKNLSFW